MATNNSVDVGLSGQTGTGKFVGDTSPNIVSPLINQIVGTHSFPVATFADVASSTDYFSFISGVADSASIQLISSNTNGSFSILAKGTGTVVIGSNGTTTIPFEIATASNLGFQFNIPISTGLHTLQFPDANVTLVSGTMLSNALTSGNIWVGNVSNVATPTATGTGVVTALEQNVTGSGGIVLATSPTLITPTLGAASATSLTFSSTSGIIGTTTNDSAAAGSVGEIISNQILFASAFNVTSSGVAQNLTSILLTAGDWDVWGNVFFVPSASGAAPAFACGISQTTNTLPDLSMIGSLAPSTVIGNIGLCAPSIPIKLASSATVYIVASATFGAGTCSISGGIYARRRR